MQDRSTVSNDPNDIQNRTDPNAIPQNLNIQDPITQMYEGARTSTPSLSQTVFSRFALGAMNSFVGINKALQMVTPDQAKSYQVMQNLVDQDLSSPNQSVFQKDAGSVADFIGSMFNPISIFTGEAGGALLKGVSSYLPAILPKAVSEFAAKPISEYVGEKYSRFIPTVKEGSISRVASLADIGSRKATVFGIGAGASLPAELESNFDKKNNTINYRGAVTGTMTGGAAAVALDAIPYLYGVIRGKFRTATGKELAEVPTASVDDELAKLQHTGTLTPEQAAWYKQYRENPEQEADLASKASNILLKDGHNVDTARKKVMYDLLPESAIRNLNSTVVDEATANLSTDTQAMTDFVIGNHVDNIRQNPGSLDGIEGVMDSLKEKLEAKTAAMKSIDELVEKYGTRNWRRLRPFSQEKLYKKMSKSSLESHEMPIVVPKNVSDLLKYGNKARNLEADIKELTKQKDTAESTQLQKRLQRHIEVRQRNLEKINQGKPELLDTKSELKHLDNSLVKDGKVKDNFKHSPEYHRLLDLAHVESGARALLFKVNTAAEYTKQAAYHDVLQFYTNVMKTNFNKLADPKKVIEYMKSRIEDKLPKEFKDQVRLEDVEKSIKDVPADMDQVLDQTRDELREKAPDDLVKEYEKAALKAKEFKANPNVLKNLIACVLGALGG